MRFWRGALKLRAAWRSHCAAQELVLTSARRKLHELEGRVRTHSDSMRSVRTERDELRDECAGLRKECSRLRIYLAPSSLARGPVRSASPPRAADEDVDDMVDDGLWSLPADTPHTAPRRPASAAARVSPPRRPETVHARGSTFSSRGWRVENNPAPATAWRPPG
jgi:hypothetical protein